MCVVAAAAMVAARMDSAHAATYAAMVVDGHTGKILHSRSGDAKRFPASLTKIMTLFLLFDQIEAGHLTETSKLKVSPTAASQPPSKIGVKPGQTIYVRDAIKALVTKSANDVAVVVAENIGGSEAEFAKLMTAKAHAIGMKNTVFKNASGLPNEDQVTTARDMITLANRLMFDHPERYRYFSRKYFSYRGRKYRNHNRLLFDYEGTDGIKTGYTRASGFNLLANVRRGDKHLIAVVFGGKTSKRRNAAMRSLLNKSWPRATAQLPRKHQRNKQPIVASVAPALPAFIGGPGLPFRKPSTTEQGSAQPAAEISSPGRSAPAAQYDSGERPQKKGNYHIHVGAYSSRNDAMQQLAAIQTEAGDVIRGHPPLATTFVQPNRSWYRARFAGFTRSTARAACTKLKKREIACVVMSAK